MGRGVEARQRLDACRAALIEAVKRKHVFPYVCSQSVGKENVNSLRVW